jgi:PAS domain S-box-containing protein
MNNLSTHSSPPGGTYRVLLIEDNPADIRLLQEYLATPLSPSYQLELADSLQAGLNRLEAGGLDLVLLDLSLPDSQGLETVMRVRERAPDLPIIVLSGLSDEEVAVAALQQGAQDYLVKDQVNPPLLFRAIRYAQERKRAEDALAQERYLFHSLLGSLPDRIYFKDAQGRFIRISRAMADQFGLAHPRQAVGKTDLDFRPAEQAEAVAAEERQVLESGQPLLDRIQRESSPNGGTRWFLSSILPLRDRQGHIIGTFGIQRDITHLKEMEQALEAERNLLRSLIDHLPDYVYVKDLHGRYVLTNPAFRRFLGAETPQQVHGKTAADFFPPPLAAALAQEDRQIIQSGARLIERETELPGPDGQRRWYLSTKVPLTDLQGQVIGLVGISRDITERKLFETRLQQANAELARQQAELQRALAELQKSHEDLKAAQFQLIQAEKLQSVGRLAATVAHEIKTPLGILRMGLEYISNNVASKDPDTVQVLQDMTEAIQQADAVVLGLLDYSAPHTLDLHPENLNSIAEQSLALVRHELERHPGGIQLVCQFSEALPLLPLDRNKIKQVFVNLLTNAIHAMPDGGTLTVRTALRPLQEGELDSDEGWRVAGRLRAGHSVVVAEVLDTGCGIPADKLDRVFEPFFTTKPPGKGTGLGLTVAKKIVELHGGALTIRNRPEGGVQATVFFKA